MDPQDDPVDHLHALRAGLDQVIAVAPEIARTAKGYHEAFTAEGFSNSEALYLAACQLLQKPGTAP